jgi:hypothetical protein
MSCKVDRRSNRRVANKTLLDLDVVSRFLGLVSQRTNYAWSFVVQHEH